MEYPSRTVDLEGYFSGADVQVWISGPGMDPRLWKQVLSIAWNTQEPVLPHYNFDEFEFSNVSFGARVTQGQLSVARSTKFVDPLSDFVYNSTEYKGRVANQSKLTTAYDYYNTNSGWMTQLPKMSATEREYKPRVDQPSLPRGPFMLQLLFAPEQMYVARGTATKIDLLDWGTAEYGFLRLNDVYFTGDSPLFANQTADPLTASYTFLAKSVSRWRGDV